MCNQLGDCAGRLENRYVRIMKNTAVPHCANYKMTFQQSSEGDNNPIVLISNEFEDVPIAEVIDVQNQQQELNGDAQTSAAQTPARKTVKDFFQKISTDDHIKIQDAMMEVDVMDLRRIQTYRRHPVRKRRVEDADDEEDDDEADAAEGNAYCS
jgi:hypothetical protein